MDDARRSPKENRPEAEGRHEWSPYPLLRDRHPSIYTQQADGGCSGAKAEENGR
jgi:hypothetical protein